MLFLTDNEFFGYDQVAPRIQQMQIMLNAILDESIRTDGYFDNATVAALITFQQQEGLLTDGVLGAQTAAALNLAFREHLSDRRHDTQLTEALDYLIERINS